MISLKPMRVKTSLLVKFWKPSNRLFQKLKITHPLFLLLRMQRNRRETQQKRKQNNY